jgi:hypothetical protein
VQLCRELGVARLGEGRFRAWSEGTASALASPTPGNQAEGAATRRPRRPDTRQRWLRLRWGGATPLAFNATTGALENISAVQVERLSIVFDEGQDVGPDNFGLAVLDNIDVNGRLVGQGPGPKSGNEDK